LILSVVSKIEVLHAHDGYTMAELKKIKARIQELAGRPRNVRLSEIEWVVKNLGLNGFQTRAASNVHQTVFTVNGKKFGVCTHLGGSSQLRPEYVRQFLNAMIDLGLYDED
jgi:hypothetical protein